MSFITTCSLCAPAKPKTFETTKGIPLIDFNQPPPEAVVKFFTGLKEHFEKKHPQELMIAEQFGANLAAMILLKNFRSTDPGVHENAEQYRRFVHRLTMQGPHVLSNAWLQGVYGSMLEDSPTGQIRFEEFQRLRDLLIEEAAPEPVRS